MDDREIRRRIRQLKRAVTLWATKYAWGDAFGLTTFAEHFDDEPEIEPIVLVLTVDNNLYGVFDGERPDSNAAQEDLEVTSRALGFSWEQYDNVTIVFRPLIEVALYYEYLRFQWVCSLIQPGIVDVASELFGHLRTAPHRLTQLPPRSLEVVLDAAFRAQGFRTELGTGMADGGVDIRLYQHDTIGEVRTLVQIKRNAPHRPIRLDAVAALRALVATENANRGLFITTSRYLPGVRRFAERQGRVLQLADTADMVRWCGNAERSVGRLGDSTWLTSLCSKVREGQTDGLVGKIVHATWGHNMTINEFAFVARDGPGAVLLVPIPARTVVDDGYGQMGEEVPDVGLRDTSDYSDTFIARKKETRGSVHMWGKRRLYLLWDGCPKPFNYMD